MCNNWGVPDFAILQLHAAPPEVVPWPPAGSPGRPPGAAPQSGLSIPGRKKYGHGSKPKYQFLGNPPFCLVQFGRESRGYGGTRVLTHSQPQWTQNGRGEWPSVYVHKELNLMLVICMRITCPFLWTHNCSACDTRSPGHGQKPQREKVPKTKSSNLGEKKAKCWSRAGRELPLFGAERSQSPSTNTNTQPQE